MNHRVVFQVVVTLACAAVHGTAALRLAVLVSLGLASAVAATAETPAEPEIVSAIDVAPVWAGHPVGFALLTTGDRQYVAFYDADRHLTVAARSLRDTAWEFCRLPSAQAGPPRGPRQTSAVVGWDSHNYVVLAADADGRLHLAGNMHNNGLTYYRTRDPGAVASFEQVAAMTGRDEERCTYPSFFTLADGRIVFRYRSGESGNGDWFINAYDTATRTWRRLGDGPIFDGEGQRNAYPLAPARAPDGAYHVSWVWRETSDCSTNHDLCHARTRDFEHWETAGGTPLALPLKLTTPGTIVDPVPQQGGIINGTGAVGFDRSGRPLLAYHKFDATGRSQAYVARWEEAAWHAHRLSDWDHRWEPSGGGSLPAFEIRLGAVRPGGPEELLLEYSHTKFGAGWWVLDEDALAVVRVEPRRHDLPRSMQKPRGAAQGLHVRTAADSGLGDAASRYLLRWETLPANRDQPRDPPWPEPSRLEVLELHDPVQP